MGVFLRDAAPEGRVFRGTQRPLGQPYERQQALVLGSTLLATIAHAGEPTTSPPPVTEVTVHASPASRPRRGTAEAVTTVDLQEARARTLDLGEQLARTEGVSFRRAGGGGSHAHLALNGFSGEQIRVFVDGVPLRLTGFALDIGDIPPNLVERIEVYRGVVPLRFGADSLGGAVNLVSRTLQRNAAAASFQVGSFGTQRITGNVSWHDPNRGWIARGAAFGDSVRNNYPIDVDVPDARGTPQPARVRRFHDRYAALGGQIEVGIVDRSWARRLTMQLAGSAFTKELQTDARMTVPYGEARTAETRGSITARYDVALSSNHELELLANVSRRTLRYVDRAQWAYDWYGRRIARRHTAGEIDEIPHDQTQWEHSGMIRGLFTGRLDAGQILRVSTTASHTTRTGQEALMPTSARGRHPIQAERGLTTMVSGLEHQLDAWPMTGDSTTSSRRVQNLVFVKQYLLHADYERPLPNGVFLPMHRNESRIGLGDAARLRIVRGLDVKASYEYATRQPRSDELFGDAVAIAANLELQSEISHNVNVGLQLERRGRFGHLVWDTNGFWRDTDRLVVLLAHQRVLFRYENVLRARTVGVESSLRWESPGNWLQLSGNTTLQDIRNVSDEGAFGSYEGARIPNRPTRFASWSARVRLPNVFLHGDELTPFYGGRYVGSFFNTWENQGLRALKEVVPTQVLHNAGLSWFLNRAGLVTTLEVQNLADSRTYDFFGAQRPGRGVFLKTAIELQ